MKVVIDCSYLFERFLGFVIRVFCGFFLENIVFIFLLIGIYNLFLYIIFIAKFIIIMRK